MPQLMPLMWMFSSLMVVVFFIGIIMFFGESGVMGLVKQSEVKVSEDKWFW